ncbi:MAG TPA: ABC transporter ATP-binding protein [Beijerinckiaceae bacterium]|nr:ABC transporter ATP-binding protein [Beijerinckiaceae bacterium]
MSALPAIEVRNLNVHFGTAHVLRDVSFSVAAGESFGLVGESGSGKSTVLRALSGLNPNWSGTVRFNGRDHVTRPARDFYRQVQMVFQDPFGSLHPRLTVDACLAEPLAIHGIGDPDRRIEQALADVGLDHGFRFRYPNQLSGGQRQRVAIARALILEPSILLLDEPTSALDVSIQAEVLNLLQDLKNRRDLTMVLVSHNLAVVGHMCSRVAVMNGGVIVEEADIDTLRRQGGRHPYTQELLAASRHVALAQPMDQPAMV